MRTSSIILSIASLSALASCDYRVFDDLKDQTVVRSDRAPSDSPSKGFAIGLVNAGGDDDQYLITSKSPPAIFMAKIDQSGSRTAFVTNEIQGTVPLAQPLETPSVMASDLSGFGADKGNVAVGAFDGTAPALYMIKGENGEPTAPITLAGSATPSGIAFGNTDAGGTVDAVDLIAAAGEDLNLVPDYQIGMFALPGSCKPGGSTGGVLVADVDAAAGDEILVAVDGEVVVTNGATLAAAIADVGQTNCFDVTPPLATIAAPGGEASFGTIIRKGDFDGNGATDLAIAAPEENTVYIFLNWTVAAQSSGSKLATPGSTSRFGTALESGDFNGDGQDEIVVSDPGLAIDGHDSAGAVYIYQADGSGAFTVPYGLHDASAETNQVFGQSLAVTEAYGASRLVVGAKNEVFTYFQTPVNGDVDFRK